LELWADALAGIIGVGPTEVRGYHARLARLKGVEGRQELGRWGQAQSSISEQEGQPPVSKTE